jgi:hypothetical protein
VVPDILRRGVRVGPPLSIPPNYRDDPNRVSTSGPGLQSYDSDLTGNIEFHNEEDVLHLHQNGAYFLENRAHSGGSKRGDVFRAQSKEWETHPNERKPSQFQAGGLAQNPQKQGIWEQTITRTN